MKINISRISKMTPNNGAKFFKHLQNCLTILIITLKVIFLFYFNIKLQGILIDRYSATFHPFLKITKEIIKLPGVNDYQILNYVLIIVSLRTDFLICFFDLFFIFYIKKTYATHLLFNGNNRWNVKKAVSQFRG